MKLTPAHQLAFHVHNAGIANARADYEATPTEFADRRYCSRCSRLPAKSNGCKVCWERMDKRAKKAAIDRKKAA